MKIEELVEFSKTLKVLYVEDNKEARESTLSFLANFFQEIEVAIDGEDGLKKFKNSIFDIILSDINMPKMNGLEMIAKIRECNKDIPILILSAYNESGYFIDTIKLGIEGYLLKPIDLDQFIEAINKVVEKIYLRNELKAYQSNLELKIEQQNEALYKQLYYDHLTGLPNRNSLKKRIKNDNDICKLMFIDINNFTTINNLYGTEIGDEILLSFATLLQDISQGKFDLYKLEGDKFVFTFNHLQKSFFEKYTPKDILEKIESATLYSKDKTIALSVSVKIAIVSDTNSNDMLKDGELAMHYAKSHKLYFVNYSEDLNIATKYKQDIEAVQLIKRALTKDRVIPFFQEIVKNSEQNRSYECLVRVIDDKKIITPFFFLDAIKKTKYYEELTKAMIEKTFNFFENTDYNFSINLSFEDIKNKDTISFIEKMLKKKNMSKQLTLEILESDGIDNFDIIKNFTKKMQDLGVKIAIDDFGSGYSNFTRILELDPDFIKIDGSLIKKIDNDKKSFIVVKTIINFANELGIKVIVEFVSNKRIYDKLKPLDIYGYQGYYFCEPQIDISKT